MSSKFSRFQHLERARGEKPTSEGQVKLQNGGRFESVAGPGETAPSSVAVPEAHVERFKLHGQTPLALDHEPTREQLFSRCIHCETDNGRFAQVCTTCGADLHSPEQLADNARRSRDQAQAEAQTREQMASVPQAAPQLSEAEKLARQQLAILQLTQSLEKERSVLGRLQPLLDPCLGVGLLRLIPDPRARWMTLAAVVGLPFLLTRLGSQPLRMVGIYLGMFLIVSFVPTSLWAVKHRRRHWWW
ncbi:MAG TPA: hypothetical protein VF794_25865 [Archangium sp.]|jgi:hypothetical protein|uniref:hypothetical protein n=1 Tax=Archangium sp. TaxID=1872627 RepID=UPI002EDB6715